MTVEQARGYLAEGQFPPGTMGPKIEAAIQFVDHCGRPAVITSIEAIEAGIAGDAGTRVVRG